MITKFFLGSNSKNGFFSLYDGLLDPKECEQIYIIKGGPGSGKSSFIKRVAEKLETHNIEYIGCSADSKSLDGAVFSDFNVAIADGTAPHVIEPKYPGVSESYINLGEFWDTERLKGLKSQVIVIIDKIAAFYRSSGRLITSAGEAESEILDIGLGAVALDRLTEWSSEIVPHDIVVGKNAAAKNKKRFISAINAEGYVTMFDTVNTLADKVYTISDNYGVGAFLMNSILGMVSARGYDTITCQNPLFPDKIDHIIVPELSLAFLTENRRMKYPFEVVERFNIEDKLDMIEVAKKKTKLSFMRKLSDTMLAETFQTLIHAKNMHDELEALYNPYVDFDSIYELAEKTAKKIIDMKNRTVESE